MVSRRLVFFASFVPIACAVACALAGCIPLEWLRPLGARIRRAEDVTPERYQQYLEVCWFFALSLGMTAALLLRFRERCGGFLASLWSECLEVRGKIGKPSRATGIALALMAGGAGLRLMYLGDPMAYDESYSFLNFARRPWLIAIADYNSTNNHLLNTFLMHWSYRLLGQVEWGLRLPVLSAGLSLLPAVYVWARSALGERQAWIAVALAAVSPMLVVYSVDARGYMFVTLATVVLDAALFRLHRRTEKSALAWTTAFGAVVVGFWAMPLMLYPAVGCFAWYVLAGSCGADDGGVRCTVCGRIASLAPLGGLTVVAVAAFYAPSYVFRGLMFLDDPIMVSATYSEFAFRLATSWQSAFRWWVEGPIPWFVWAVLLAVGLGCLPRRRDVWLRIACPFAAALLLNLLQWVAPPPRIFMYLAPWVFLVVSHGVVALLQRLTQMKRASAGVAFVVVICGWVYALTHPVLFFVEERTSYVSVPDVIGRLQREVEQRPDAAHRLIAPLPCDLPSLFYMEQRGFQVPLNGEPQTGGPQTGGPQPGEAVWLIARLEESPDEVLRSGLVDLLGWVGRFEPWSEVARFETLVLYRSRLR